MDAPDKNLTEVQRAMDAWNAMTEEQRAAALHAANTAIPAVAMRRLGFNIPEMLTLPLMSAVDAGG